MDGYYIEPLGVPDVVINGIAKIENLRSGLVRVWLYSDECLEERSRIIRCKLVFSLEDGIAMNQQAGGAFSQLHRESHPLKVVS